MPDVFRVADILVAHAVRAHPGEIAIIAYYGSHAKGTAGPSSDLDLFYIPDEGKAVALCCQFVLDGLPYDFWPITWSFAEAMADARSDRPWSLSASLIADARVLYFRSAADLARFEALQARVAELTRPEHRAEMLARARAAFTGVLAEAGRVRLAAGQGDERGARWACRRLIDAALNCLALANQTYFTRGWEADLAPLLRMPERPADLQALVAGLMEPASVTDLPQAADALAGAVRGTLRRIPIAAGPGGDAPALEELYPFALEYGHKVLKACRAGNRRAAMSAACQLQDELNRAVSAAEDGASPTELDFAGDYAAAYERLGFPDLFGPAMQGDLETLAIRVDALHGRLRAWLTGRGAPLNVLKDEAELRRFLERRDPVGS